MNYQTEEVRMFFQRYEGIKKDVVNDRVVYDDARPMLLSILRMLETRINGVERGSLIYNELFNMHNIMSSDYFGGSFYNKYRKFISSDVNDVKKILYLFPFKIRGSMNKCIVINYNGLSNAKASRLLNFFTYHDAYKIIYQSTLCIYVELLNISHFETLFDYDSRLYEFRDSQSFNNYFTFELQDIYIVNSPFSDPILPTIDFFANTDIEFSLQ